MESTTPRAVAARETRRRVVDAAGRSFLEHGYPATTIRAVAEAAGVSQETVYKSFRGKPGLLKAVYDVTMAGDDDDRPIAQRPEAIAVREATTPAASARAHAELARTLNGRAGPLIQTVLAARGSSTEVDEFAATIDGERLVGAEMAVRWWAEQGWLRSGVTVEQGRDVLWIANSPDVLALARQRGWSDDRYYDWIVEVLLTQVLLGES